MSEVWECDVSGGEQLLLLALADYADDDGENIYPSIDRIAWKTGYSTRAVRYILKGLRERRVLVIIRPSAQGRPNEYRMDLDKLPPKRPFTHRIKLAASRRLQVIEAFNHTCQYCLRAGDNDAGPDGYKWEVDRIVPSRKGGTYTDGNITLACLTCNRKKGANIAPSAVESYEKAIGEAEGGATRSTGGAKRRGRDAAAIAPKPSGEPSPYSLEDYLKEKAEK